MEENLLLAARVTRARKGRWDLQKVYELFPPLRALRTSRGDHLSGGEQKMLAIGRALMKDPDLLLLDEPAEGLAPLIVRQLIGVLRDIRHTGVTMLLTDQNLTFCRKVADRAYIIERGTVAAEGPMATIWQNQDLINRYLAL